MLNVRALGMVEIVLEIEAEISTRKEDPDADLPLQLLSDAQSVCSWDVALARTHADRGKQPAFEVCTVAKTAPVEAALEGEIFFTETAS